MPSTPYDGFLWLTALLLGAFASWTVGRVLENRRAVGEVLGTTRAGRGRRRAWLVALALAALSSVAMGVSPLAVAAIALVAGAIIVVHPDRDDSQWGTEGVARGWHARRYEELEEWRLTGDHLRWRLFGEWTATDVPGAEHDRLRGTLERAAPERESRFDR